MIAWAQNPGVRHTQSSRPGGRLPYVCWPAPLTSLSGLANGLKAQCFHHQRMDVFGRDGKRRWVMAFLLVQKKEVDVTTERVETVEPGFGPA